VDSDSSANTFDPDRILFVLDSHRVDFIIVGGVAAQVYGASRMTTDFDCIPSNDFANLTRLAGALRQLNARLRVAGMTDSEARQLPLRLDAHTLAGFGSSTWTTDAGSLDILVDLRDSSGGRRHYSDLLPRAVHVEVGPVTVRIAALRDIVESKIYASRQKDLEALPELEKLLRNLET
jgi:hypothetical protein